MIDLPRARALVRLDGPGHILPIEPVTPEGSRVWRVVHFPLILFGVALVLVALAERSTVVMAQAFARIGYLPGARMIAAVLSAAIVVAVYGVFVRLVERRRDVSEFDADGAIRELAVAFAGGLLLFGAFFTVLLMLGGVRIVGLDSPGDLVWLLVSSVSISVINEVALRGLFFRLIERLVGSWFALAASAVVFWAVYVVTGDMSALAGIALVLNAGLMPAALFMMTRRLWAVIGLHAACNFAQSILFGTIGPDGASDGLARAQLGRPDWLTGGSFGADTSLPALLVVAAVSAILVVVAARRGRIVRPIWQQRRR